VRSNIVAARFIDAFRSTIDASSRLILANNCQSGGNLGGKKPARRSSI